MVLLEKIKLHWLLLSGFIIMALISSFAAGLGIYSLQHIQTSLEPINRDMRATVNKQTRDINNQTALQQVYNDLINADSDEARSAVLEKLGTMTADMQDEQQAVALLKEFETLQQKNTAQEKTVSELKRSVAALESVLQAIQGEVQTLKSGLDTSIMTRFSTPPETTAAQPASGKRRRKIQKADLPVVSASELLTAAGAATQRLIDLEAHILDIATRAQRLIAAQNADELPPLKADFQNALTQAQGALTGFPADVDTGALGSAFSEIGSRAENLLAAQKTYLRNRSDLKQSRIVISRKIVDLLKMLNEHTTQLKAQSFLTESTGKSLVEKLQTYLVIFSVAAVVFSIFIGIMLGRSVVTPINTTIKSLSSAAFEVENASVQISHASQQMASGSSSQASNLEEISASLEQMASMTKQNADNATQANSMASEARKEAESSMGAMGRMSNAINRIKDSSDKTAKIIRTIDEIAFQTNLLALNAAVEAARAGEAGRGFAVVAEEVRSLAQRSAEAARDTTALIDESHRNAEDGVAVSAEVEKILSTIVEDIKRVTLLTGEVAAASNEQSLGIGQITNSISSLDKLTQQTAANAEQTASTSTELASQSRQVNQIVEMLYGMVESRHSRQAQLQLEHRQKQQKQLTSRS